MAVATFLFLLIVYAGIRESSSWSNSTGSTPSQSKDDSVGPEDAMSTQAHGSVTVSFSTSPFLNVSASTVPTAPHSLPGPVQCKSGACPNGWCQLLVQNVAETLTNSTIKRSCPSFHPSTVGCRSQEVADTVQCTCNTTQCDDEKLLQSEIVTAWKAAISAQTKTSTATPGTHQEGAGMVIPIIGGLFLVSLVAASIFATIDNHLRRYRLSKAKAALTSVVQSIPSGGQMTTSSSTNLPPPSHATP